ncbi:hypothetical protein [Kluyvera intermedia]|uniref:hypothetical protein n=1 Tax=Kluyvera intermedia TaxID=61648 RepID=UPI003523AA20
MATVLDALKAMRKATYCERAALLSIEPLEALSMLREQKEQGLCDFYNGSWSFGTAKKQTQSAVLANKQAARGEEPVPVNPETIRQLLQHNGAMETAVLASAVNRGGRGMVSVMRSLERQGVVIKDGEGKGVIWSLPTTKDQVAVAAPALPSSEKKHG